MQVTVNPAARMVSLLPIAPLLYCWHYRWADLLASQELEPIFCPNPNCPSRAFGEKVLPPTCGYCSRPLGQGAAGMSAGVTALAECCISVTKQLNEPYDGMSRVISMCIEFQSDKQELANRPNPDPNPNPVLLLILTLTLTTRASKQLLSCTQIRFTGPQ